MLRAAAALVVLAGALLAGAPQAQAAFPAAQGRLVLLSEEFGFAAPVLVRQGGLMPIGLPLGVHGAAAMAPNGTEAALVGTIAFVPGAAAPTLFLAGLIGAVRPLDVGTIAGRPAWSPDGSRIAYAGRRGSSWDIYVVGVTEGSVPFDLTPVSPADDLEPRWSPDGTTIAFESDRTGNFDVFTMNTDGGAVTDVTGDPASDTLGDWSPDSQRLVFSSTRTGNGDVYVTSRNGGPATRLTSDPGADTHAAWSPDGTQIAYSNDRDGDSDAYEVSADGSTRTRLTDNAHEDLVQDWQPLRDLVPPVVRSLRSSSRRGKALRFRFRVSESSGHAIAELDYGFSGKNGSNEINASREIRGGRPGHVYTFGLPAEAAKGAPASFRFCITVTDASANVGGRSCAPYHLLPSKTKKKRP